MQAEMNQISALFQKGKLDAARRMSKALVQKHPRNDKVRYAHALICQEAGDFDAAIAGYEETAKISPSHVQALANLGGLLNAVGRFDEAVSPLKRAVKLLPTSAPARYNLAQAYFGQKNLPAALEHAEKARMLDDRAPDVHSLIGALYDALHKHEEAAGAYERLTALAPDKPGSWTMQASNLQNLGKFAEAEDVLNRGLQHHPENVTIHMALCVAKRPPEEEAKSISALAKTIEKGGLDEISERNALFLLGDLHDRAGDYKIAFDYYQRANRLKQQHDPHDREAMEKNTQEILSIYTPDFFRAREGFGHDSDKPIFVVGTPRSGTTLMERLLSSHPSVTGCGELGDFSVRCRRVASEEKPKQLHAPEISKLQNDDFLGFAESFLAVLDEKGPDSKRAVDASPGNVFQLGLVSLVFPNAHVVLSQRNPIDAALSNYFRNFVDGNVSYANDFDDIVHSMSCHRRVLKHYDEALPLKIHKAHYEEVVEDTEGQVSRLLEAIGLQAGGATFDNTASSEPIRSASIWQARQPVYKTSKERWRNYEPYIGKLIDGLAALEEAG